MGNRRNNQQYRMLTLFVTVCFILLGVLAPALHTHDQGDRHFSSPSALTSATHSSSTPAFHKTMVNAADNCPLCDWLAVTYAAGKAPTAFLTVLATQAAALLLFVRLTALCQRPLPRRGLRAPPVFAC